MGIRQEAVKQRCGPCLFHAELYNSRSGIKCRDQLGCKQHHDHSDQLCHDNGYQNAKPGSFPGALGLSGAEILSHECCHRHGKAVDGQERKAFDLGIGAISCHSHFAKGVDIGLLYHHIGKRNNRILNTRGKSDPDNPPQHRQIKADAGKAQLIALFGSE